MKKVKHIIFLLFLFLLLIYTTSITSIPDNIILFQGERLNLSTIFGMHIDLGESIEASSNLEQKISDKTGKTNISLKLGNFKVKEVTVNVIPKTVVIPGGQTIGLKLYTNGVLVVGMSEIVGEDNQKYKPYQNSGIEEGDMIIAVNGRAVTCTDDLVSYVNESKRGKCGYTICEKRESKNSKTFSC